MSDLFSKAVMKILTPRSSMLYDSLLPTDRVRADVL